MPENFTKYSEIEKSTDVFISLLENFLDFSNSDKKQLLAYKNSLLHPRSLVNNLASAAIIGTAAEF